MNKGKLVNISILLITAMIAMSVTILTFQHVTNNLSWTTMDNPSSYNNTTNTVSTVITVMPIVFGIAVVLIVMAITLTWLYLPKETLDDNKYVRWFINSVYYFAYGLLGMICFTPPFLLGYFMYDFVFVQGNTSSINFIGQTLVFVIGAYFAIAMFGYFFKHVIYDQVAKKYAYMHPFKEEKKNNKDSNTMKIEQDEEERYV